MADNTSYLNHASDDKFLAIITVPRAIRDINASRYYTSSSDTIDVNSVQFMIQKITLPSISIPATTVKHKGQSIKVSTHTRTPYEPIVLTMVLDSKFENYEFFKEWMDRMNHTKTGEIGITNEPEYVNLGYSSNMSVVAMNEYNEHVLKFDFTGAFPVHISGINYAYGNGLQITVNITFEFSQYLMSAMTVDAMDDVELIDEIII